MKCKILPVLSFIALSITFNSCSDDNSIGGNNNGGGNNSGGCGGGPSSVVDIDGNFYNVVTIGNQCWMRENLKTTRYKNGTVIPVLSDIQWTSTTTGACADYLNDPINTSVYGKLYNWYAVANPAGLCPTGWHEPEEWEWNVLVKNIDSAADTVNHGFSSVMAGGEMKEIGLTHWISPNAGATNNSGFTGLPGGGRNDLGNFSGIGAGASFWSSTAFDVGYAWGHFLNDTSAKVGRGAGIKRIGKSVRCVRD